MPLTRMDDGTRVDAWFEFPRDAWYRFDYEARRFPLWQEAYDQYGQGLCFGEKRKYEFENLDALYVFLYGQPIDAFFESTADFFNPNHKRVEPQTWTPESVTSMDWDLFCFSFVHYLCAKNNTFHGTWEALRSVLTILREDPELLARKLQEAGGDAHAPERFWNTVEQALSERLRESLNEENCYRAICLLEGIKPFFSEETYQKLEAECCAFFDRSARNRIDAAVQNTYTAQQAKEFDIENLFFYEQFFSLPSANRETKRYVYAKAYGLLSFLADKIAEAEHFAAADAVYESALKYAATGEETARVTEKRGRISALVQREKAKQKKQNEKESKKRKRSDAAVAFLGILFFVSIIATVVFGILALTHTVHFAGTAFFISLGVLLIYLIAFAVGKDKR